MANRLGSFAATCSCMSKVSPKLWKVETKTSMPSAPERATTRSRISPAALLVKVTHRIASGSTPCERR